RDAAFAGSGATTAFLGKRFAHIENSPPDAATLALAATLLAANCRCGEWQAWSNNPARLMRAKFGDVDVALRHFDDAYHARIGDTDVMLRILSIEPPHARIALNGVEKSVSFAIDDRLHLAVDGESYALENTLHAPARRATSASDGRLTAPMNGRVVAVNV